ncbi:hypothetical protein KI387_020941 [Taxus chinensis]|uniref:Uncharacterized protein n=1 Tax=Taxus chinensis TaxID=29808 RepID=A0AA38GD07_TAXCH|nr:hypothetical protein KI387_020941 [Taxus chinensis]
MAAGLVDAMVGRLGGMIVDEISKEASLFLNFRKDFKWLKKKLVIVSTYLKDADVRIVHNKSVKGWLLDVADIAWDAEDIIEECAAESIYANDGNTKCPCAICPFNNCRLFFRYKMARRIKDVRDRMKTIMEDAAALKLVADLTHSDQQASTSTSQNVKWKRSSVLERDARPVAIEPKVEKILQLIDDPAASIIAVVGMGGAGKTFLLQNVFNRIKERFEYSIWLSISQTYSLQRLQADLAAKINLGDVVNGRISEVQAAEFIYSQLESKRSLIVLDDVWRPTGEDDLIRTLGLPVGNSTQCKIVVTTRNEDVCRSMNARVYEMQVLSQEESWELFCAFAFSDCEQNRPQRDLKQIASEIEKECARLPLAVKTVAASLTGKTSSRDWKSKLREIREISNKGDPIMEILKLSYDSLPAPLKPCFAYLSFFPEDERIDPEYLIYLWIAEGFIEGGGDQVEIGWSYIHQLANLCLVETEDKKYLETIESCKMHDLLLDLAIRLSEESQCAFSVEAAFNKYQTSCGCRRILLGKQSINDDVIASNSGAYSASRLRTLSLSSNDSIQNDPAKLFTGMRALWVLDLSLTKITALSGNLKLLRVLNLSRTDIVELPVCVRSMKSLRFLDISYCRNLQELPVWIGELNCLEYLNITGILGILRRIPEGISKLVSLQLLRSSEDIRFTNEGNEKLLKLEHLVHLINLREVRIRVEHVQDLKRIEEGILAPLVNMRILSIENRVSNDDDESVLPHLSAKMLAMKDHLEILYLSFFAMPAGVCDFSNLVKLHLMACDCADYPALEEMPNLRVLIMTINRKCRVLPEGFGKPRGFPQLRYLLILAFDVLEELPDLEEGAMPLLERLEVGNCRNVKKVPCGLELLKSLKVCDFRMADTNNVFGKELEEGGEYWNKIKANIPNLTIRL